MKEKSLSSATFVMLALHQRIKNHTDSVHERKKPFKCNICDTTFTQKGVMKQHVVSVHEGKKPFQCTICDASFGRRETLNRHVGTIHKEKQP